MVYLSYTYLTSTPQYLRQSTKKALFQCSNTDDNSSVSTLLLAILIHLAKVLGSDMTSKALKSNIICAKTHVPKFGMTENSDRQVNHHYMPSPPPSCRRGLNGSQSTYMTSVSSSSNSPA